MPRHKSNDESGQMRRVMHHYMQRRALVTPGISAQGEHLDEDTLAAFVEGRLGEREAPPLVSHLVACAFCRRATSELIRLESELGETALPAAEAPDRGRIRRLLDELAARVLPQTDDNVVFAYHAPAEDFEKDAKAKGPAAEGNPIAEEKSPGTSAVNRGESPAGKNED